MPKSPIYTNAEILNFELKVGGSSMSGKFQIRSVEVGKELNKIPFAEIVLQDGNVATSKFEASDGKIFLPGKEVEVLAGYGSKKETIFKGIIVSQRLRIRTTGSNLYIRCYDKAIAMTVGRKSNYFLKSKDSDVISKVVKDSGSGVKATVKATSFQHPEIIQYYSTDWDFILQRAQVNGQVIVVNEGEMEVGPPKFSEKPAISITYGLDVLEFDSEIDARQQYSKVSCAAWDPKTQKVVKGESKEPSLNDQGNFTWKTLASDIGIKKPIELQTSAPIDSKMLKEWADSTLLYARLSRIRGKVKFRGTSEVEVGGALEVNGLGDRFSGQAYVSRVYHYLAEGKWITTVDMGLPTWFGQKPDEAQSQPAAGLLPPVHGIQTGIVKKLEEDPEKEFRIQVDVPVIAPSGDGVWARLASFYATKEAGLFVLPEVGDEVLLGFINDDPRFPVILGMVYSSKIKPPAPYKHAKENQFKALVTKSKMKLEFDDKDKIIILETPGKNRITISDKDKKILIEDQNKNVAELSDKGISLTTNKDITLDAKGKLNLTAMGKITIESKQDVAIAGLNVEGKAQVGMKMAGNAQAEFSASGPTTVKGATVMIN
jgi:Rhs element Vgr protein